MENEEWKEQENNSGKFVQGLLCGVLLTLLCLAGCLLWYRHQLYNRFEQLQRAAEEAGTAEETEIALDEQAVAGKLAEMENIINQAFMGEADTAKVEKGIYSGMLEGLADPYAQYYTIEDQKTLEESTSGVYSGIGAILSQDPDTGIMTVVTCFEGAPAQEAGMEPGDIFLSVDGESTEGMDLTTLVAKIKTGTSDTITLGLLRDGEEMELAVERREVKIPTVSSRMLENGIGYLQILEFDEVTVEQFKTEMASLRDQGMEKLIIDLRDNPGGILQVVCDVLNQLLPEGLIVYTEDKYGQRSEYFSDGEHALDVPLAVLINEKSASAAEIFAGAVKDYGIGTLVGTTTFGKGIVQRIFSLSDGAGMKLTVAKYFTPKGNDIHEKGIEPDVEVQQESAAATEEEDAQLQKAIEILS